MAKDDSSNPKDSKKNIVSEGSYIRPDRVGKKTVIGFVDQNVFDEIRIAAIETRSTVQMIVSQALENWVKNYKNGDKATRAAIAANLKKPGGSGSGGNGGSDPGAGPAPASVLAGSIGPRRPLNPSLAAKPEQ